jgi:hypothetical protein
LRIGVLNTQTGENSKRWSWLKTIPIVSFQQYLFAAQTLPLFLSPDKPSVKPLDNLSNLADYNRSLGFEYNFAFKDNSGTVAFYLKRFLRLQ